MCHHFQLSKGATFHLILRKRDSRESYLIERFDSHWLGEYLERSIQTKQHSNILRWGSLAVSSLLLSLIELKSYPKMLLCWEILGAWILEYEPPFDSIWWSGSAAAALLWSAEKSAGDKVALWHRRKAFQPFAAVASQTKGRVHTTWGRRP